MDKQMLIGCSYCKLAKYTGKIHDKGMKIIFCKYLNKEVYWKKQCAFVPNDELQKKLK